MYKDVWKKFGVKILIIFCSVLLLGGVAVAAPRLRADQAKPSFEEINDIPSNDLTMSIPGTQPTYTYDFTAGVALEQLPKQVKIVSTNANMPFDLELQEGSDFEIVGKNDTNIVSDGTYILLRALQSSTKLSMSSEDLLFKYKLNKSSVINAGNVSANLKTKYNYNDNVVSGNNNWLLGTSLQEGDQSFTDVFEVSIEKDGKNISLSNNIDYTVNMNVPTETGSHSGTITLKNYDVDRTVSLTVLKNVSNLTIKMDATGKNLVVEDNGKELTDKVHYYQSKNGSVYTISGIYNPSSDPDKASYYVGNTTYEVTGEQKIFNPTYDITSPVDYKDINGDITSHKPINVSQDGAPLNEGVDYKVDNFRVKDTEQEGATAGTVYMTLTGIDPYRGTKEVSYELRRSINDAGINLSLEPAASNDNFEYTPGIPHIKNPKLAFIDSPDYFLRLGKDIKVEYKMMTAAGYEKSWTEDTAGLVDAGTVFVRITGSKDAETTEGGYYGKLEGGYTNETLTYEIEPAPASRYSLVILPTKYKFPVTCTRQDVLDKVYLQGSSGKYLLKDILSESAGEYEVEFYKDSACTQPIEDNEWGNLKPQIYYGVFEFKGNLEGELKVNFEVENYSARNITVELGRCSEDTTQGTHIYTGSAHKPNVKDVKYDGVSIDWIPPAEYGANTDVGTGSVTVSVAGGITKTETFPIIARALNEGTLELPSSFGGSSGSRTHEFCGRSEEPKIQNLTLVTTDGNKRLNLTEDKDYTVLGLYKYNDPSDTPVNLNDIDVENGTEYCYRITSCTPNYVNNNTVSGNDPLEYVQTEPFTFTPRLLNSVDENGDYEIVGSIGTKTQVESDSYDYGDYILNNIKVIDNKYGDTLVKTRDFEITDVVNNISKTGTILFRVHGKGCYGEYSEVMELLVGKHINNVWVREKNQTVKQVTKVPPSGNEKEPSGEVFLVERYAPQGDTFNITFNDTNTHSNSVVSIQETRNGSILRAGDKYDVSMDGGYLYDDKGRQYTVAVLQGKNGYHGQIEVKFFVEKIYLTEGYEIEIQDPDSYIYTGKPIEAIIKIKRPDGSYLTEKEMESLEINYYDNINASINNKPSALVTVTGKPSTGFESGQAGQISKYYVINPKDLSDGEGLKNGRYFQMPGFKGSYPYRSQTTISANNVKKGVWLTDFEIRYSDTGDFAGGDYITLEKNTDQNNSIVGDYSFICTNNESVTKDAKLIITGKGNYTGTVELPYEITAVSLGASNADIKISIDGGKNREPFTGLKHKPKVKFEQTVEFSDGTTEVIPVAESEYTLEYHNTLWVSEFSLSNDDTTQTCVRVVGNGNYLGSRDIPYTIYGDFNRSTALGAKNSDLAFTTTPIKYSENMTSYEGCAAVYFLEKRDDVDSFEEGYDPNAGEDGKGEFNAKKRLLFYGTEYTISLSPSEKPTVGKHSGYINQGSSLLFVGGRFFNDLIVIQASLTDAEVKWNQGVAAVPVDQEVALKDMITVTCGGRDLRYGVDYIFGDGFDGESHTFDKTGEVSLTIIPTDEAKDLANKGQNAYLTDDQTIRFDVTTELSSSNVSGLKDTYTYTGRPVINIDDIVVQFDGVPLKEGKDYRVTGDLDATDVREERYTIRIEGISSAYIGNVITHRFQIVPLNIETNGVTVKFDPDVPEPVATYTGSTVLPTIKSITAVTSSGSLTLKPGDDNTKSDYEIVASNVGDHINWTNPKSDKPKPTFIIRGLGNFTGEITGEYTIEPRSINDADVIFDDLGQRYYDNGKPVTPQPTAKYGTMQLTGILYNNDDVDEYQYWQDYTKHFTYEYKSELTSVGKKTIHIMGIGNFAGEKDISFEVIPLDLDKTELRFKSEEAPVYDGEEQRPAFGLWYNGEQILEWTGSKIISDYISTANVNWDYNVEASNEKQQAAVTVTLAETGDNYQGSKTRSFMIQPASLASHVKFMHLPEGQNQTVDLNTYKLNLPFVKGQEAVLKFAENAATEANLTDGEIGIYYDYPQKANHGVFLGNPKNTKNFTFERVYVEPDTDDVEVREGYGDGQENGKDTYSYAGKIKYTITGTGNYKDSATFWYYVGTDISSTDVNVKVEPKTAVYNSTLQAPEVTVSGVDKEHYSVENYKNATKPENHITAKEFIDAATYYIRIEGKPWNGTYASNPQTYTYTITPRPLSNSLVIDGFKKEYPYTGLEIRPIGISVTDYIDRIKYRLTEDLDYTLSYKNNLNAGTAFIEVQAKGNFSGSASANFLITSSTISSGSGTTPDTPINGGIGEISGSTPVSPNNVILTMDTANAMFYTGNAVYPKVSIAGMTENIDYTVTFSNNIEVGVATVTITGIGNNRGTITKTFNIIAPLSKCTIAPIPAQQYTGSPVTPTLTVTCGKNILIPGTDYNVTYSNNVNIGTATVTINAANNSKYTGSAKATFSIGNDVGGFIISGYAPTYTYTGNAITPSVVVETGSDRLTQGTDYTVSYSNNINAGKATITVKGVGKYSGTQTANFMIEAKSIAGCDTTEVEDRTYTGDAYTPSITVTDGTKVLTNGVDYTLTYTNNKEPGTASILIQGTSNNYSGTKIVNFKIAAVAVKGLKATNVKYSSLKLKWTKQGYADGYQICDAQSKVIKNVTKNSATISKLSTGKTYRYKVRSYIRNADGTRSYGAFSSVISATTKLKTPVVKVVSKKTGQARISWSKVAGADGYEIYYKKSSKDTYRKLKTVNNANVRICNVRGMKSGDRAYFRVRAFKKNGSKKVYSAMNKLKVITVK